MLRDQQVIWNVRPENSTLKQLIEPIFFILAGRDCNNQGDRFNQCPVSPLAVQLARVMLLLPLVDRLLAPIGRRLPGHGPGSRLSVEWPSTTNGS